MTTRHHEEHLTRNTECLWCWCYTCNDLTEHAVSNGEIGRCKNDHSRPKPATGGRRRDTPDTASEINYTGAVSSEASKEAETLRHHIAALDGMGNRGNQ